MGANLKVYRWVWSATALLALSMAGGAARAQRASENAVSSAEDAFGTRVGTDNIGLYSQNSARGFNPMQAGNVRIEGLYFDQHGFLGSRIARGTTMRIGLAAQSYPFPAPTGIADIALVLPDGTFGISSDTQFRRPTGLNVSAIDVKVPVIIDRLGFTFGGSLYEQISEVRGRTKSWNAATMWRWTPADNVEFIPFIHYATNHDGEQQPLILAGGPYLPPKYDRTVFFTQTWADRRTNDLTAGALLRMTPWKGWRLQAAIFRSDSERPLNYSVLYRNTQPNGTGNLDITKFPLADSDSYSGELRASGVFTSGRFRHTVHIAVRGRDTTRVFGGGSSVSFGASTIGVYRPVAQPNYVFTTPRDRDVVRQYTPGVTYIGQWANVGEFSAGLQKAFYHRTFGKIGLARTATSSEPWLYNGTLALYASPALAFYAGYTRGLEEFGTAPDNAANAGAPVPASLTRQFDSGLRYRIIPGLTLVAGVFEVSKPFFDRNTVNIYTDVGDLRHRGIELSLTGRPFTGLTVVGGAVFLQARVMGLSVDQGLIGKIPPGTSPRQYRLNLQYGAPSWRGFTVETQFDVEGAQTANRANTLRIPALATLTLGVRYPFTVVGVKGTLRAQVVNVTNKYGWTVDGASGRFAPNGVRQYVLRAAADF